MMPGVRRSLSLRFGRFYRSVRTRTSKNRSWMRFLVGTGMMGVFCQRTLLISLIIPGFMEKDGVRIGFGIMGCFNQPQAHAQFIANIADYGLRFRKLSRPAVSRKE